MTSSGDADLLAGVDLMDPGQDPTDRQLAALLGAALEGVREPAAGQTAPPVVPVAAGGRTAELELVRALAETLLSGTRQPDDGFTEGERQFLWSLASHHASLDHPTDHRATVAADARRGQ